MVGELVNKYQSSSQEYKAAYEVFLRYTDLKSAAKARIDEVISYVSNHALLVDVGAADGMVTGWYHPQFSQIEALEPNPFFYDELTKRYQAHSNVDTYNHKILDHELDMIADLILCAHVYFHIDRDRWMQNTDHMTQWLSSKGVLALMLQTPDSDAMRMLDHFNIKYPSLREFHEEYKHERKGQYVLDIETIPSMVRAPDIEIAYAIAEFMLNFAKDFKAPSKVDLEAYIKDNFQTDKGFEFSCDSDLLLIQRKFR